MLNTIVQRVQRTKLNSESFVNVYQFIRYLSVVFKKNSFAKDLIYPSCISKCFGGNILLQSNLLKTVTIPKRESGKDIESSKLSRIYLKDRQRQLGKGHASEKFIL